MKCSGLEKKVHTAAHRPWHNVHHNCAYTLKCLSLHTHINTVPGDDVVGSLSRCENTIGAGSSYGSCELNSLLATQDIRNIKKKWLLVRMRVGVYQLRLNKWLEHAAQTLDEQFWDGSTFFLLYQWWVCKRHVN